MCLLSKLSLYSTHCYFDFFCVCLCISYSAYVNTIVYVYESLILNIYFTVYYTSSWSVFAAVWNEIIDRLRLTDHITNVEKENHLFSTFTWLSKPVYLPLFQTAGCVETAVYSFKESSIEFHKETEPTKKMKVRACIIYISYIRPS